MKRWSFFILLLLVGCGTPDTPTSYPVSDSASNATPTLVPTPTLVTDVGVIVTTQPYPLVNGPLDEVFVTLHTTGGIAGLDQILTITREGTVLISQKSRGGAKELTGQATPEQVAQLEALLQSEAFSNLDAQYMPERQCCDLMTYELITPSQIITTMDGATYPAGLSEVLDLIHQLADQAK